MACNCLIRLVKNHTQLKYLVIYLFLKGVLGTGSMHFPIQPVHRTPFKKTENHFFSVNLIYNWFLIHRKFKTVPYHVAAKSCVSGVKSCTRNSQIPYSKANSIFEKILCLQ